MIIFEKCSRLLVICMFGFILAFNIVATIYKLHKSVSVVHVSHYVRVTLMRIPFDFSTKCTRGY